MFPPNTKILVVDDMTTMRKLVMKVCRDLGYSSFVEAADGKLAWETLQNNTDVGLIISDWNMPNVTGLEFLKLVRTNAQFKELPFLMVTAEAEQGQIIEAIQSNVSNYVIKPFTPASLSEKIKLAYKKHFPAAA